MYAQRQVSKAVYEISGSIDGDNNNMAEICWDRLKMKAVGRRSPPHALESAHKTRRRIRICFTDLS